MPEMAIYACETPEDQEILTSGIADAFAVDANGTIETIVDWKSDVAPAPTTLNAYRAQIKAYCKSTHAARGLLVLMTTGRVIGIS